MMTKLSSFFTNSAIFFIAMLQLKKKKRKVEKIVGSRKYKTKSKIRKILG